MLIDILLQVNASEKVKLDKELTTILTMSGTLRRGTSIVDPVIVFECKLTDVVNCNYITIPQFGRSYFVTNVRSVGLNLVELTCHVDVLSSFKESIRQNTAIIKRQENKWNLYLNDGSFKVYQNPIVLTKAFPSGFTTQELVLAVAGS